MKQIGGYAPDFERYGTLDVDRDSYRLSHVTDRGELALLLFYPMDFSPVCTAQLCSIPDGAWFGDIDGLNVWGISADKIPRACGCRRPLHPDTDPTPVRRRFN